MIKKIIGLILITSGFAVLVFGGYALFKGIGGLEGLLYVLTGLVLIFGGLALLAGDRLKDTIENIFASIQF